MTDPQKLLLVAGLYVIALALVLAFNRGAHRSEAREEDQK